jgi:nucleotide-binding universal stress UspA family protein
LAFSPRAEALLYEAKRISQKLNSKLVLIHAGKKTDELIQKMDNLLDKVEIQKEYVQILWEEGSPVEVLCSVSKRENIDLLILGALQNEAMLSYYIGSVARKISRKPPCTLLLVTHPNKRESNLSSVVVNGLDHAKTGKTIETALSFANQFDVNNVMIVEEVAKQKVKTKIDDDETLAKAKEEKEKVQSAEDKRIQEIINHITNRGRAKIETKCVFGKVGYSIGHFAEVKKADLLVMNSPDKKLGFLDKFFPHDLEYILSDMPCDLMIVEKND